MGFVRDLHARQVENLLHGFDIDGHVAERRRECISRGDSHAVQIHSMGGSKQHDAANLLAAPFQQTVGTGGRRSRVLVACVWRNDGFRVSVGDRRGSQQPRHGSFERRGFCRVEHASNGCRTRSHLLARSLSHMLVYWGFAATYQACRIRLSPRNTGIARRTGGCSATYAPAIAACAMASEGCATCASASTMKSSWSPMAGRRVFASTLSRRNRSIIFIPAPACCPSARQAVTSPASSARTGT